MLEGILGRKVGMTQIYSDDGVQVSVTVIDTGECYVVQRKTRERDGYDALQVGLGVKPEKRVSRPMQGHFKKAGSPCLYRTTELKGTDLDEYEPGQALNCADLFKDGDFVDITGVSKGKGFQGSMKRHNFGGGRASHGSMHNRAPGSIGQSSDPSRVFKGMRMAGHMGNRRTTVQNVKVVSVRGDENLLLVNGAVPGAVNAFVEIRKAHKK